MRKWLGLYMAIFTLALVALPEIAMAATAAHTISNMTHVYITLAVLFIASVFFFTEWIPLAVTAMLVPCALSTLGVISVKEAWMGFGDTSILTIIGLFMLGEATFATGFAQSAANGIIKKAGKNEHALLVVSIIVIGVFSAFLNNAGITAITLPMLIAIARRSNMSPSRILMPTAFAASVGGTLSMVGTAPNMIANALMLQSIPGCRSIGFFEFGYIGLPLLICTVTMYIVFGKWMLPPNKEVQDKQDDDSINIDEVRHPEKKWLSAGLFFGVIVCMATGIVPLTSAAILGAMLAILTGCITLKEAYKSVDWSTIFLFAGMLAMSHAMNKSGTAEMVGTFIVTYIQDPQMLLAMICLVTAILTNIMSNTATTAIMIPLALPVAIAMDLSPLPFVLGIVTSASSCFLTPIATPSNTLVLAAGGYKFLDYFKYGWPLQLIAYILCVFLIPVIWPFNDCSYLLK